MDLALDLESNDTHVLEAVGWLLSIITVPKSVSRPSTTLRRPAYTASASDPIRSSRRMEDLWKTVADSFVTTLIA